MENSKTYAIPGVRAQSYMPPGDDGSEDKKPKKPKNDSSAMVDPAKKLSDLLNLAGLTPAEKAVRITIWNRVEQRKIAGTAAPLRRNLAKYLQRNPQCDVFVGQDQFDDKKTGEIDQKTGTIVAEVCRVTIWNPMKKTKITGNAAPLPKNLQAYFNRHPGMEVYDGQDFVPDDLNTETENDKQPQTNIHGLTLTPSTRTQARIRNRTRTGTRARTQTRTQARPLTASQRKHVGRGTNPPGIHYPLIADSSKLVELEWERMTSEKHPLHIFHETHEIVPESYWTGHVDPLDEPSTVTLSEFTASTEPTKIPSSSTSSCPLPFECGSPMIGADVHEFRNLDEITYEEMASSWSNTPMWTDPNCQYKIESAEPFITAIQADRSLICDDGPLDLVREFQDFSITGFCENDADDASVDLYDANQIEETNSDEVDLFLRDIFVDSDEVHAPQN